MTDKKNLDWMKKEAGKGRMNRREFVQLAIAAGVTATAAETMFSTAARAEPKKGGHFVNALTGGGTKDVLDPAQTLDSYMINVSSGQLRNNLIEIGPDGQLTAELAESWEGSDNAATWAFKIRKGVEFHNGRTMTPNDVVASFNHHRGENTKSAASGLTKQIKDVKADGDMVIFTLEGGNADWPAITSDYHLTICPANDDGSMDWQSGVGTGGYALENFDPGVSTKVRRNPNYWKEGRAWFDSIDNLFIADSGARSNALITGSIHSMSNLDLKTVHLLQRDQNVQVVPTYGNKHATLPMHCDTAPFDNNDVRLAIKYSIKRDELVAKILRGQGEVGNDSPVGPANIYRATAEEMPQRPYDPDKAKFHLKKAGMDSLKVQLHIADTAFEGGIDAATLIAESAKASGIEIEVVREADDSYWDNVWLKKPWCGSYWGGRPTEDWIFSQIYSKGADWNESKWDNARFNELLLQARSELDTAKRREMYVEMQKLCNEDGGAIIPMFMAYTHAISKKVGLPAQLANNWELDGHKNGERWWFV
ncbi:MAG: peptide ABC transporter substrate-binding protein [Rhizobiales bacterium]|nr:peptide ABC transporter substrate-binding protein [Hyphomicrobiales bacterium]